MTEASNGAAPLAPPAGAAAIRRATAVGAGAILLWSTLAVLTVAAGGLPPFFTCAVTFAIAFAIATLRWLARGEGVVGKLALPPSVWVVGVGGLFGYHALYFLALASAPPVEASLLNYLWPLLIVLFSGLLPGERLGALHIGGALLGLAGAALVVGQAGAGFAAAHLPGYAAALAAAVIWALYSVLSRRMGHVSTDAVGAFCGATALLAALMHLALEPPVRPDPDAWLALLALGLGPVGAAFFLWDVGMKRGDIRALGALSYATPLLSTALLALFGGAAITAATALGGALIVAGGVLGARDLWRGRGRN